MYLAVAYLYDERLLAIDMVRLAMIAECVSNCNEDSFYYNVNYLHTLLIELNLHLPLTIDVNHAHSRGQNYPCACHLIFLSRRAFLKERIVIQ